MDTTCNCPTYHPFVLEKIETDKKKADLFTKGFNEEKFVILRKLLCGWWMNFYVVSPWAFPCQHDNVNERERKDVTGSRRRSDVIMTSEVEHLGCC